MKPHSLVTPPSLIVIPADDPGYFHTYDFISKGAGTYENQTLYWLSYFKQPRTREDAVADHPDYPQNTLNSEIDALLSDGLLQRDESDGGKPSRHEQFRRGWTWDLTSAAFHFTIMDSGFASLEESRKIQTSKLDCAPSPALIWRCSNKAQPLPVCDDAETMGLLRLMRKRRTNRTSARHALSLSELGTCLFAGLGITGYCRTEAGQVVPLAMTPSGGARNPYEAYVFARRCGDFAPGLYRYNGDEHKLEPLGGAMPESLAALTGGQDWVDDMAAVVVLVAYLERTMWKYPDPNAYRVVLIEAGHIVQSAMLAATSMGLTICPTAALAHSQLSEALGLSSITHTPVYAFTLDKALANPDKVVRNGNTPVLDMEMA